MSNEIQVFGTEGDEMSIRKVFQAAANAVVDASNLKSEVTSLREELAQFRHTVDKLLRERDAAVMERDTALDRLATAEHTNEGLRSALDSETNARREAQERVNQLDTDLRHDRETILTQQEQLHQANERITMLQQELVASESHNTELLNRNDTLTTDLVAAQDKADQMEAKAKLDGDRITILNRDLEFAVNHRDELITGCDKLQDGLKVANDIIATQETTIARVRKESDDWMEASGKADHKLQSIERKLTDCLTEVHLILKN
jgi:chromosome segregation ATPase